MARAEAHLAANPDDGRGWDVLAPIYLRMQRFGDAVTPIATPSASMADSAARKAGLGEAIADAAGGMVTAEAQAAFERALTLEPANPKASFYLATALAQEGRSRGGRAWQAMLGDAAGGFALARRRRAGAGRSRERSRAAGGPRTARTPRTSTPRRRCRRRTAQAMIETMVAGLDEKLRQNPRDAEGWKRLVRSYVVLGKADQARDALKRGIAALGADSEEARSSPPLPPRSA